MVTYEKVWIKREDIPKVEKITSRGFQSENHVSAPRLEKRQPVGILFILNKYICLHIYITRLEYTISKSRHIVKY